MTFTLKELYRKNIAEALEKELIGKYISVYQNYNPPKGIVEKLEYLHEDEEGFLIFKLTFERGKSIEISEKQEIFEL